MHFSFSFLRHLCLLAVWTLFCSAICLGQSGFNLQLTLDYNSAERTLELYDGTVGAPREVASLRGSQLALGATALLSGQRLNVEDLEAHLRDAKYKHVASDDVFRMKEAIENAEAIKELLVEIKRRNFGQRVISTVSQLFPPDTRLSKNVPVYLTAFGHQNISAFVQSIQWRNGKPVAVGDAEGELTIVVNLARTVFYGSNVSERFIGTLSVVAHEVFHVAFGHYQNESSEWQSWFDTHRGALDHLMELTQNEGIAHYLSFEQRGGYMPPDWRTRIKNAFREFDERSRELASPATSVKRAQEIIRASNASEYWESYGAITGLFMALTIDRKAGRSALHAAIAGGPPVFYETYDRLAQADDNLPRIDEATLTRVR